MLSTDIIKLLALFIFTTAEAFNTSIELRDGVLFKKIDNVKFVDEQYSFYVRIKFKKFIDIQNTFTDHTPFISDSTLLRDIELINDKLNATTEKLFFFVYSNIDREENDTNMKTHYKDNNFIEYEFESHKTKVIEKLLIRMDNILGDGKCFDYLGNYSRENDDKDSNLCFSLYQDSLLLFKAATVDIELEILTFMVTLAQTINSKVLSEYIVSREMMLNILQKIVDQPFYSSFVTNPTRKNIFEIYNLCIVQSIFYNTADYSLLFKINFPLQHSQYHHTIYEVIPLYTPSRYKDDNYSVRLDAWWPNSKYLAINEDSSSFMTFSDYSCRYVKVLNTTICKDYFEHIRSNVDYCVFSLFINRASKYCRYMFAAKPTQEFINLENGVWFYSYNLDKRLKIRQLCTNKDNKRNKHVLSLNPKGTGIFMFDAHCHGGLIDNTYEFMSIDRDNKTGGFRNINVFIKTDLQMPKPPINDNTNDTLWKNGIIWGVILAIVILYIMIIFFVIFLLRKRKKVVITCPTNNNSPTNSSPIPLPPTLPAIISTPPVNPPRQPALSIPLCPPPPIPTTPPQQTAPVFFSENGTYESVDGYLTMRS